MTRERNKRGYSPRKASNGDMRLARMAGTIAATMADDPSVTMAAMVTNGLYGFIP